MISRDNFIKNHTYRFFDLQDEMREYAEKNHVPIISLDSLDFLISMVKINKPKKIIEFGTAIAYSTIAMAVNSSEETQIISFERNQKRYEMAIKNIKRAGLSSRIKVYNIDAFESKEIIDSTKFDMVFIDAAKGQYKFFFDLVFESLNSGGIIVSDNLFHKDMILEEDIKKIEKRQRTIYRRMTEYIEFLKNENSEYYSSILPIGDGMAVTYKY